MAIKNSLSQVAEIERKKYLLLVLIAGLIVGITVSIVFYFVLPGIDLSVLVSCAILIMSSTTAVSYGAFLKSIKKIDIQNNLVNRDLLEKETSKNLESISESDNYKSTKNDDIFDVAAILSNEFRKPITILNNNLDELENNLKLSSLKDMSNLNNINFASNQINNLINNIIYASKYENRQLKLDLEVEKLINIYNKIREEIELMAKLRNKKIKVSILPNLPNIKASQDTLGLVFYNIIEFATRYSSQNSIISIISQAKDENILIEFKMQGSDVSQNEIKNIFQKYNKAVNGITNTNIGLYVTKAIVEAHGGNIIAVGQMQNLIFRLNIPTI